MVKVMLRIAGLACWLTRTRSRRSPPMRHRTLDILNRGLSEDIFSEYISRLENEIGVTINQSALNQVISGGANSDVN